MKVVIDTSILIDNLRGGEALKGILKDLEKENSEIYIPTVVFFEIFSGKSTREEKIREEISTITKSFQRVDLTEKIARRAGEIYRELDVTLGPADYFLAATALEIGGVVLTLNQKHFRQIPNLTLYSL